MFTHTFIAGDDHIRHIASIEVHPDTPNIPARIYRLCDESIPPIKNVMLTPITQRMPTCWRCIVLWHANAVQPLAAVNEVK